MSRNIPLGILVSGGAWKWANWNAPVDLVYLGGAYSVLTNASYFLFGRSTTGTNTASYSYSANGTSWNTGTMPSSSNWGKAATNGTRLVVSQWSTTGGAWTTNGTTWTATTIWGTGVSTRDILWDGTRFLAVGTSATSNLAHSTDGATWTRTDIGPELQAIAYDGVSRYIALALASTATHRTTTGNPTTVSWDDTVLPAANTYTSIAYGNGIWLVCTDRDVVFTSSNGTTWTAGATLPTDLDSSNFGAARIFFHDGKFWHANGLGLATQPVTVYSSTNGATWTTEAVLANPNGDPRRFAAWSGGPNFIFGIGYDLNNDGSDAGIIGTK